MSKAIAWYGPNWWSMRQTKTEETVCEDCGRTHAETEYSFSHSLHHIDFDASNDSVGNFKFLCSGCHSREHALNDPKSKISGWNSPEANAKSAEAQRGKKLSDKRKQKLSESMRGKPQRKATCPHCDKTGGVSSMKRWHFDNCTRYGPLTPPTAT